MYDLAIARTRTRAYHRCRFEHQHLATRQRQRASHCQPYNAGADHHYVDFIHTIETSIQVRVMITPADTHATMATARVVTTTRRGHP